METLLKVNEPKSTRLFAADCAESVLHIFESVYPKDKRPRNAIQAARDFENGLISSKEMKKSMIDAISAGKSAGKIILGSILGSNVSVIFGRLYRSEEIRIICSV